MGDKRGLHVLKGGYQEGGMKKEKGEDDKHFHTMHKLKLEKKFLILVRSLKKTDYSAKISEIESKIPTISASATTFPLITVENKIPDVSSSAK